jgi:hypothetical protein
MTTIIPQSLRPKAAIQPRRRITRLDIAIFCFAAVYLAAAGAGTCVWYVLQ